MKPNKLQSKEVQQLIADYPQFEEKLSTMFEHDKEGYVIAARTTTLDNKSGKPITDIRVFVKSRDWWIRASDYHKSAPIMGLGAQEVVILHDPSYKPKTTTRAKKEETK